MAVSLESLLGLIPEGNRHLLDHKMDDRPKLATIAKSIPDWPTVAEFLPGIRPNDIEAIKYDNRSLYQQKIGLLDKWKERNGPMATYRQLAESLYKAEVIDSVHTLCIEMGAPKDAVIAASTPAQPAHHTPPPATHPQPQPQVPRLPPPTMKDLSNLVHTTNPYELGLQLNIATSDLNIMQLDHRNDIGSQLRQVLCLYLRQTEEPSWMQLATVLRDMKEMPSANAIMKKFGFSLPGQPEPAAVPAASTPHVPASSTPHVPAPPSGYQQSPAQYPAAVQGSTSFPTVVPTSSQSAAMPPPGFQQPPYYYPPPGYPGYVYGYHPPPQAHPSYYPQQPPPPTQPPWWPHYPVGAGPPPAGPPTAGLQPPAQPPASNTAAVLMPASSTTAPTLTPSPGQATATVPAQPPQNFQTTVKRSV